MEFGFQTSTMHSLVGKEAMVLLLTALGSFLALDHINILCPDARKHPNTQNVNGNYGLPSPSKLQQVGQAASGEELAATLMLRVRAHAQLQTAVQAKLSVMVQEPHHQLH
ncbi:hypothetical protein AgCh_009934 [Apium graveolens]